MKNCKIATAGALLLLLIGCNKNQLTPNRLPEKFDIKKAEAIIREKGDMEAKRILEITLECRKSGKSLDERKKLIDEALQASEVAYAKSRNSKYTIPYSPDWGGHEKTLRGTTLSDLTPESPDKNKMKEIENELKIIEDAFKAGKISEIEKANQMTALSKKYKTQK
jgi:hypothetical protein